MRVERQEGRVKIFYQNYNLPIKAEQQEHKRQTNKTETKNS